MAENVGSIAYDVTLDTSKLVQSARTVDAALDGMGTSLSATALAAKTHTLQVEMQGKALRSTADAAQQGAKATAVNTKATEQAADALKKQGDAAKKAAKDGDAYTMSAKAQAAAARNIPAQMTDIISGLSTGQSPFAVLMQQGGQLKDMFGGIGPAVRAVGTYIAGLITPVTAAAAGIGALAIAFFQGRSEADQLSKSLILTGDRSGVTTQQLNQLAADMGKLAGITRGQAVDAITVFVQAGVQGVDQIGKLAQAAIKLEKVGGPSVADTAAAFKALADSPVQASLKLNDAVNFLTRSLFLQIDALTKQGKTTEAAKIAQDAYAAAVISRSDQIKANLGILEKAWGGITGAAKSAWDAMLGIGRTKTPEEALAGTLDRIRILKAQLDGGGFATTGGGAATGRGLGVKEKADRQAELDGLQEQVRLYQKSQQAAADAAKADADRKTQVTALAEFEAAGDKYLNDRARMTREIAVARELGVKAGLSEVEINKRIAAIQNSYAGKSLAAQAYYDGLVAASATALAKINAEEQQALTDNKKRAAEDTSNAGIYAAARLQIVKNFNRQREILSEQTLQQIADFEIAVTTNAEAKIEMTRTEAIRRADRQAQLGVITYGAAERAKALAVFQAEQAILDIRERNAVAGAETALSLTKSAEQRIRMERDETIRIAEQNYVRDAITFEEMTARKVAAEEKAQEALRNLQKDREQTKVDTLKLRASGAGFNPGAQEAVIRAETEQQLQAERDKQAKDIENAQIYADKMVEIEADMHRRILQSRVDAFTSMLDATSSAFGSLAEATKSGSDKQNAVYKLAFAAQKASAIASAIVSIQAGAAEAYKLGFPAGLAAAAGVIASGARIISTIRSTNYGGGREYGGPASAGSLYRINEGGRPEMFTAANGAQYMMPTADGRVTSAGDVGSGGKWNIVVNNMAPGAQATASVDEQGRTVTIAIAQVADQIRSNSGPVWSALRSSTNVAPRIS